MVFDEKNHIRMIEIFREKLRKSTPLHVSGDFSAIIYDYYRACKRDFPWRHTENPYHIYVSEVMLQQTQTDRVVSKYTSFLETFPTVQSLAAADFTDVLTQWQGLGYNRRAQYLHNSAKIIVTQYSGIVPSEPDELVRLPGIGDATSKSIAAFAFNKPVVFFETNIRAVYIHFFFRHVSESVSDKDILPILTASLDRENPREWYSALMDYGVMLKKKYPKVGQKSKHYVRQSPFRGSLREVRGAVLKLLLGTSGLTKSEILATLDVKTTEAVLSSVLEQLIHEKFLTYQENMYAIIQKEDQDGIENPV